MIMTTQMIVDNLKGYSNPMTKLGRLVKEGQYTPVIRGLYETDPTTPGYLISNLYSPSYLSFEYALSRYGLIPEGVRAYTLATYGKNKQKTYHTPFGTFRFRDIPEKAFSAGIKLIEEGDYTYWMASPEKALCDKLYAITPIESKRHMEALLLDDLRIYEDGLESMDCNLIDRLSRLYHSKNVSLFRDYMLR